MQVPRTVQAIAVLVVLGALLLPSSAAAPSRPAHSIESFAAPRAGITKTTALNWAGYYATGVDGSVSQITGTWTEPKVKCGKGPSMAVSWVGMDGVGSFTVEQTGTQVNCSGGVATYAAWYELYPRPVKIISSLTVAAGDKVSASVSYVSGDFELTIEVAGHEYSKLASVSADRSSAECIVERAANSTGYEDLTNFGTFKFASCKATFKGVAKGIGGFGAVGDVVMKDTDGHIIALPSTLNTSKDSFSISWKRSA